MKGPVILGDEIAFPPVEWAGETGLLAIGGDLSPERLLEAYRCGVFPWPLYEDAPLLWWSPDPRFVLEPRALHVPRSLKPKLGFEVRLDTCFSQVIHHCATVPRPDGEGTWITRALMDAFVEMHRLGWAHSAECFLDGELAGGLYGMALGGCFFGESMFTLSPDASKVAFVHLVRQLEAWGFDLVDCQLETDHLARFGAVAVPRADFGAKLERALIRPNRKGRWRFD